jgi:hypothetical protein
MRRAVLITLTVLTFAASGFAIYWFDLRREAYEGHLNWVTFIAIPFGLMIAGIVLLYFSMSDNIYNLKAGKVIEHSHCGAYWTAAINIPARPAVGNVPGSPGIYIPSIYQPETWGLRIEDDRGRTGWKFFVADILPYYPVGSYYPKPAEQVLDLNVAPQPEPPAQPAPEPAAETLR